VNRVKSQYRPTRPRLHHSRRPITLLPLLPLLRLLAVPSSFLRRYLFIYLFTIVIVVISRTVQLKRNVVQTLLRAKEAGTVARGRN